MNYLFVHLLLGLAALVEGRRARPLFIVALLLALSFWIAVRYEVGVDWPNYQVMSTVGCQSEPNDSRRYGIDPMFHLLSCTGSLFGGGHVFINASAALLFALSLVAFLRRFEFPLHGLVALFPVGIVLLQIGSPQQAMAFSFLLMLLASPVGSWRRLVFAALASSSHGSGFILFAFAVPWSRSFAGYRKFIFPAILVLLLVAMFSLQSIEGLLRTYFVSDAFAGWDKAMGAYPRYVPTLLASVYLLWQARIQSLDQDLVLMILAAAGLLLLLPMFPVVADRASMYLLPLQMTAVERFLACTGEPSAILRWHRSVLVVGFYASLLCFWLALGSTADAWVPYQVHPHVLDFFVE